MKIDTPEHLGQLIRQARKAQKLTQVELAGVAGVGERFIGELEHGKSTASLGKALHVCKILGIQLVGQGS